MPTQLETLTSKDIYKTLIEYDIIKSRGKQICEIRLYEVYLEMYRKQHCVDRKIRDFDWKCIQDAVNTEVRMINYEYSNGKCKFCEIEDDTIEFLLYDCDILDGIWEQVEGKLNDANITLKIQFWDIILGVTKSNNKGLDTNNRHKVNKVISTVKWMIWKQRYSLRYEEKWLTIYILLLQIHQEINSIIV